MHITKKTSGDFYNEHFDECKRHFELIETKDNVINQLTTITIEKEFLNDIFDGVAKRIYNQQKKDYDARWWSLTEEEREKIRKKNYENFLIQFNAIRKFEHLQNTKTYKQQQRQNKKGFFEILLNLILGGR